MKEIFPGYFKKSEIEIRKIWDEGLICFDANVLLNLYRYSNETREALIRLIKKFSDKIFLPHQAALEYNRNRYEVIAEQEKTYKAFTEKIIQIQKDLQSTSKPPFLSDKVHDSLNKVFKDVNQEVEESITKYSGFLNDDPIYEEIVNVFKSKITNSFEESEIENIIKEGEERYKSKIPPGYEDEKNKSGLRKYGDLILWKQIIKMANEKKSPIIFITDERKVDWWWKIKDGRNMGPRQELVEEIHKEASVDFHMYSSERFLSYGQEIHKEAINQKAIREIQEMKRADIEALENVKRIRVLRAKKEAEGFQLNKELAQVQAEINKLNKHLSKQQKQLHQMYMEADENPDLQEYLHDHSRQLAEYELEREFLQSRKIALQKEKERINTQGFDSGELYGGEENSN